VSVSERRGNNTMPSNKQRGFRSRNQSDFAH